MSKGPNPPFVLSLLGAIEVFVALPLLAGAVGCFNWHLYLAAFLGVCGLSLFVGGWLLTVTWIVPRWLTLALSYVTLGSGAVIVGGVRIGERAVVGAGAVVTRDVPPGETVVGNPARKLRRGPHQGAAAPRGGTGV